MIVPLHRSLARGTLGSLLRQAGPNAAELLDLLDRGTAYLPLPPGHGPEADPLTGITPPETSSGGGGDGPGPRSPRWCWARRTGSTAGTALSIPERTADGYADLLVVRLRGEGHGRSRR